MGNRAVIIEKGKQEGIYLHWNGGRDSVEPILFYAKNFLKDDSYLFNSVIGKIGFIATCLGLHPDYSENYHHLDCDNYDNGVYVVNEEYEIIERLYLRHSEQKEYDFVEFIEWIDECMPKPFKKGKDFIKKYLNSDPVETIEVYSWGEKYKRVDFNKLQELLNVGDEIYYRGEFHKILGKNDDTELKVNGSDRKGCVFFNYTDGFKVDEFKVDDNEIEKLRKNPNSYLSSVTCTDKDGYPILVLNTSDEFRIVRKGE